VKIGWSTVGLDFHAVVLPLLRSDSLGDIIEVVLLCSNVLSESLDYNIVGTNGFHNSLQWESWDKVEWSVDLESEITVHSLSCNLFGYIKIENFPDLVSSIWSVVYNDLVSFLIFVSFNFNAFLVLPINEVSLLIGEDLPPSRVGAPDLHFSGSSWSLDIKWLIVILSLNCQRFLVEIPNLRFSSIWCLDDHVSVVNQVHVSVAWHSWNNVEVSKDIESKFFIEFSLPGFTLPFISVDYIPLLVNFTILVSNNDVSILSINVSLNFNDLCFLVNNVTILIFEELPPSWVNAWCEMKVGWSAVGLDFHGIVLPLLRSDSLINIIEEVLLCCDILSPSFEPDVVSTVALSNSLHWKSRSNVEWSVDMESEFSWKSLSLNLLCLV